VVLKEFAVHQDLVDLFHRAKAAEMARLALDREARLLKSEEDGLKALLHQTMSDMGLTELNTPEGKAVITEKQKPYISDFAALEGYIREHGALDLLQKRLTESAVKLRWEDGIQIPGVGLEVEQKLTLK
jgi:hypothetical protein